MNEDFRIVDKLAHAYGWSVEYIANLGMEEITGLMEAINERESSDRQILSYIVLLAVNGKTIDSAIDESKRLKSNNFEEVNKSEEKKRTEECEQNIMKIFQHLGVKPQKIIDGVREGKLEA